MARLNLSPLPCLRAAEVSSMSEAERDGFVDDSVVLALVAGPAMTRPPADPKDLALAADDLDFAGWRLPSALPAQAPAATPLPMQAAARRAAPPEIEEPVLGAPHCGNHRWWLAGLAEALSTLLFSALLFSLSSREGPIPEAFSAIGFPAKSSPAPSPGVVATQSAPELTGVSTGE